MKVLIVEDETIAYEYLSKLIKKIEPDMEIIGSTESITQTIKWLESNPSPDLIFMDIHLSDGLSFSIFEQTVVETPIIFTTAYDEYAIHAFKVNSMDYLLKPVEESDLRKAIKKFRKFTSTEKINYLEHQAQVNLTGKYFSKLLIPHRDHLTPVSMKDITYFYTTDHHTEICMADGTIYPYNKTLDSIYQNLDPEQFFRVNKQFIISRDHVKNITIWFDRRLLITLDKETPERIYVSKNKASEFKSWMVNGTDEK